MAVLSIMFAGWSAMFIHRSSILAIDGKRYFCLFDDAMISMRYAWNLSHGNGLVWNPGEYVQGYSNFLMTILMAGAAMVDDKSIAVLIIQCLGVIFVLISALIASGIAAQLTDTWTSPWSSAAVLLSFVFVLLYYPLVYWSLMGMETGLLTVLLLAAVYFALRAIRSGSFRESVYMSILLGMAFLTRMDSVLLSLPLVTAVVVSQRNVKTKKLLYVILGVAGIYGCAILFLLWFQYSYYGNILPNTFTLKLVGLSISQRLADGLVFTKLMAKHSLAIWFLASIALWWRDGGRRWLLFSVCVMAILYQIVTGGDAWPLWRFTAPVTPLVIQLATLAVLSVLRMASEQEMFVRFRSARLREAMTIAAGAAFLIIVVAHANRVFWTEMRFAGLPYQVEYNATNVNIAVTLRETTTSAASVAVFWAGAIPYYSGRMAMDMLGKSDPQIATRAPDISGKVGWMDMKSVPGHNKYDLSWSIKKKRPTFVQSFVWGNQDFSQWSEKHYVSAYYRDIHVFLLKDSPDVLWDSLTVRRPQ